MRRAASETDLWFPPWASAKRTRPRVRLFCIPFAAGSAAVFRPWNQALPDPIEVRPVELPGHGSRMAEPLLASVEAIVEGFLRAVRPLLDMPFAIYGHSMGGRIGFELTRALTPAPLHFFASGSLPPQTLPRKTRSVLPEAELVAELKTMGATSDEILADPEMRGLVLDLVRNDFRLVEAYRGDPHPPLAVPVTALGGKLDPDVTTDDVRAWSVCTSAAFRDVHFDAGHFFLLDDAKGVHEVVRESLLKSW